MNQLNELNKSTKNIEILFKLRIMHLSATGTNLKYITLFINTMLFLINIENNQVLNHFKEASDLLLLRYFQYMVILMGGHIIEDTDMSNKDYISFNNAVTMIQKQFNNPTHPQYIANELVEIYST